MGSPACASTCRTTESPRCASGWRRSGRPVGATSERAQQRSPAAAAAAAARVAQPLWALLPPSARARYLRRAAVAMLDELDELAVRLAEETGWPRSHLVVLELLPAVRGLHALADEGPPALADRRLSALTARLARRRSKE